MYKKLLVPIDEGKLSRKVADHAVKLAQALNAQIVGLHVSFPYIIPYATDGMIVDAMPPAEYRAAAEKRAHRIVSILEKKAMAAKVKFSIRHAFSDTPWVEILAIARKDKCDAIVMASHGRRGITAILLGSETQKVLTHSKLPVIVVR